MNTTPYLLRALDRRPSQVARRLGWRPRLVSGWAGLRGSVSLAAALALPHGFPERDLLIFLTLAVIFATLVGQGLTLPLLIRRLGIEDDGAGEREELQARREAAQAGIEHLERLREEEWTRDDTVDRMLGLYRFRSRRLTQRAGDVDGDKEEGNLDERSVAYQRLVREVLDAQRRRVVELRNQGQIADDVMHVLERELDLEDQARDLSATGHGAGARVYSRAIEDSPRIILFDIDGTLVSTGGAGAAAWKQAFDELYGIPADIGQFTDAGMTDPDVGAKTFEAVLHREPTARELAQLIQRRLEHLPEAVAQSEGYRVLPGVPERLRQLSRDGHLLGIITGNGDGAAAVKLARADLNRWFTFGAYATAGVDRAGIVERAVERGEAMLGRNVPNSCIYVVGDTPLDVKAAHAVECTAIGVATGHFDEEALREAGADHVVKTLEEELPIS